MERKKFELLVATVMMFLFIFAGIIAIELAFGMMLLEFTNEDDLRVIGYMLLTLPLVYFPGEMCMHCVRVWFTKKMRQIEKLERRAR